MKGNVTFDSGTIIAASSNVFGTTAKTVTINAPPVGGTTPQLTTHNASARTIPALIPFVINTTANVASFTGGGLTFGGSISGSGSMNVNGGVVGISAASIYSATGGISASAGTGTVLGQFTGIGGATVTGGTLQLSNGTNNYTGINTVTSGKLGSRATGAWGTFGGASDYTTVSNGGTASVNTNNNQTINEELRLAGDGLGDGNTGALTVEGSSIGNTIAGPISLTADATIHVTSTSQATFTNTITGNNFNLKLQGGNNATNGNGTFSGTINLGAGGLSKVQTSTYTLNSTNTWTGITSINSGKLLFQTNPAVGSAINASGGTIELNAGGARMLDTTAITTSVTGKVNLQDNKSIVRNGDVGALTATLASGYGNGTWNGANGIMTSQANAVSGLTSLGIATAAQVRPGAATFGGIDPNDADALIMYTYAGDATLDGQINGDDYVQIDAGYSAASTGWYNGDFNYSGGIDADDYFIIDSNYTKQSLGIIPASAPIAGGVTAVPEPASLALLGVSGIALLRRRRRA
jgi:autotransporter-associated beta strand protein